MKEKEIYTYKAKTAEQKLALETLKQCHSFLEKKLGVETNLYLINDKRKKYANTHGIYNAETNMVVINLATLKHKSIKDSIDVLSHEMRHALQYKNKWLKPNKKGEGSYWKGKLYNVEYENRPWEKDAFNWESKYSNMAISSLSLTKKAKIKL
jgi:hypothetical protein